MNEQKKNKLFHFAVDLFLQILQEITKRKINYKCNNSDSSSWRYFINTFQNADETFVQKFIEYGMQSWFNSGSQKDYGYNIRFSWIFGRAAVKRWNALNYKSRVYVTRTGLKKTYKISTSLKKKKSISPLFLVIKPVEENFKKQYHNTRRGLLWCVANTTLYFHKSSQCATCNYKNECKEILKKNFLNIYVARGYEKE